MDTAKAHQIRPDVCRILGLPPYCKGARYSVTLDQYKAAIRVRIAELQGITHAKELIESESTELINSDIPDYPNDLNACHEWQILLTRDEIAAWCLILCRDVSPLEQDACRYTALQACEAEILRRAK